MSPGSSIYRAQDPVENFKLKFRLREVSRIPGPRETETTGQLDKTVVINWQQKIYSPWEIADYLKHKSSNSGNAKDVANRKRLQRLDTPKQPVASLLEPAMLFTYVDSDGYFPVDADNSGVGAKENYTAAALRSSVDDDRLDGRQLKLRDRIVRERTRKTMHICLATDVNCKTPEEQDKAKEHLLCTVHLYSDGMMEISPDFSCLVEEEVSGAGLREQIAANGAFTTDKSVHVALRRGLKISTYSVRSSSGSEFHYTIENLHGLVSPMELEEIEKQNQVTDTARALKLRGPRGPESNWLQDPPKETFTHSIAIHAEIVSATGFTGENLFVTYEVVCPDNWDLRTGNLNDGVASVDSGSEKSYSELDEEEDVLFGRTQISTVNDTLYSPHYTSSGSGGRGDISLLMPSENIVWGTLFFLTTCIAVVVGPGYAFWIVPALVIAIVLGSGAPGGVTQEFVYLSDNDFRDLTWGERYTLPKEGACPALSISPDPIIRATTGLIAEPVATFGHPISLSFDIRDSNFESSLAPSASYPVILFEVYSTQLFGGNTLEGYGYMPLKESAGYEELSVATWRPIGSRVSRLMEFFVGGNPVLHHSIFAEVPNKMASSLSRFGVLSEGSGSVRLRLHTIKTDPRVKVALLEKMKKTAVIEPNIRNGRRSVDDIVSHFKAVEVLNRSMSKSGAFTSSLKEGEALSSSARAERVSQILNRARSRLSTATKDDIVTPKPSHRPGGLEDSRRLNFEESVGFEEKKSQDDHDSTPLIRKPPIKKPVSRGEFLETAKNMADSANESTALSKIPVDPDEVWDAYETPIRIRKSPSLGLSHSNIDDSGPEKPSSEHDPLLLNEPTSAVGTNARARQIQRLHASSAGEQQVVDDGGAAPDTGPKPRAKFSNPKKGGFRV